MKTVYKLRFNTGYPMSSKYPWRVIRVTETGWTETLAMHVCVNTISQTTTDILPSGIIKHHITIAANDAIFFHQHPDGGYEKITFI